MADWDPCRPLRLRTDGDRSDRFGLPDHLFSVLSTMSFAVLSRHERRGSGPCTDDLGDLIFVTSSRSRFEVISLGWACSSFSILWSNACSISLVETMVIRLSRLPMVDGFNFGPAVEFVFHLGSVRELA